ncbi:MAG TPA: M24 family metallopeptidase, partial [Planctomycetota bacterium]|nr:M24 family metallopeptidase [Planctomycetota bacterium]
LKRLGLQIEGGDPGMYLPHGVTHGLGLDVHDPMPVRELAPGMVITVEPGIYIVEEGIGVRIEDDVLITEDGARILSTGAPRTIDEIEAYMALREF